MYHLLHYALVNDFLLIHVGPRSTASWFKNSVGDDNPVPSESRPGRLDLPFDCVMWLQQFRGQNASILQKLDVSLPQVMS